MMEGWQQQEAQVKESRWAEKMPQRWKQPKGGDGTEMKREGKLLRCTLLNGSAWSTERKYMRRYNRKCDVFFGIEHRLRKEEMEEQFNKKAKEGKIFAADAARITDERVVGEKEGAVTSILGNEGRITQAWVCVRGGVRFFRKRIAFRAFRKER